MSLAQVVYILTWLGLTMALLFWAICRDRVLGMAVAISILMRLTGIVAIGPYLQEVRGREYIAEDEPGYQNAGLQILARWDGGIYYHDNFSTKKELSISGGYSYWNALLIAIWGPSLVAPRIANAAVATAGIALSYLIAAHLFSGLWPSRLAALALTFSPSLLVWSLTNLKETFLAVGIMAVALAALRLVRRPATGNVLMLLLTLLLLGSVRHFYAAVLGWLSLLAYLFLAESSGLRKVITSISLGLLMGGVLFAVSGSFLALDLIGETQIRYIVREDIRSATVQYVEFPPNPRTVLANLPYVLFGRFSSRGETGGVMALVFMPEWILSFVLIPLACCGTVRSVRQGNRAALIPAGFASVVFVILAWLYGDPWTIYRFRTTIWPLVLILAAGGFCSMVAQAARAFRRLNGPAHAFH
ncbi:MAG: hypothetical protein ACRD1R_12845 [Acidobacteriota bacterium]